MNKLLIQTGIILFSIIVSACGGGGGGSVSTSAPIGTGSAPSTAPGGAPGGSGQMGATAGGVQDMSYARALVSNGMVPPADAFIVEGMYSEHDLPVTGPACDMTLCIQGAMGIAPDAQGVSSGWVQVGLSSNIDADTFTRRPITIVAVVDVSGSMSWNYLGYSPGISTAKQLLNAIASNLNGADQFALVKFNESASTVLSLTPGNSSMISSAIGSLNPGGSTSIESGLRLGIALAETASETSSNVRILLLTDAQPNVGATTTTEFDGLVSNATSKRIGMTVFGIGMGLRADLVQAMSYQHGGNAFSVMDVSDVESFMTDNWPWLVSPIAYDLNVTASMPAGLRIVETYGFPQSGSQSEINFAVDTVFLSKNRGALLLKVQGESLQNLAVDLGLSYYGLEDDYHESNISVSYSGDTLDPGGHYMPQLGIAKTVALTLLVTEMRRSAELYGSDPEQAINILSTALTRFSAYSVLIGDDALSKEANFWMQLLALMQTGAEQGNLYGIP